MGIASDEHELSGIYDVPHGAGLAVVFPAWMKYVYKHDIERFVQFAVGSGMQNKTSLTPANCPRRDPTPRGLLPFYRPACTCLSELDIPNDRLEEMAEKLEGRRRQSGPVR